MNMEMGDRFAAVRSVINDQAKAGIVDAFLSGNVLGNIKKMAEQRFIGDGGLTYPCDLLLGNDQDMDGCVRGDVVKSQAEIVFVDDPGGNFPGNDFREYCAHRVGILTNCDE